MGAAFGWGLLAASSVLLGGGLALRMPVSNRALGLIVGFGAGVLISAVAYELVRRLRDGRPGAAIALGLFAGCAVFSVGDVLSTGWAAGTARTRRRAGLRVPALAIVLGIVLDGIPESIVIGVGLLAGAASASQCSPPCSSRTSPRPSPRPPAS